MQASLPSRKTNQICIQSNHIQQRIALLHAVSPHIRKPFDSWVYICGVVIQYWIKSNLPPSRYPQQNAAGQSEAQTKEPHHRRDLLRLRVCFPVDNAKSPQKATKMCQAQRNHVRIMYLSMLFNRTWRRCATQSSRIGLRSTAIAADVVYGMIAPYRVDCNWPHSKGTYTKNGSLVFSCVCV